MKRVSIAVAVLVALTLTGCAGTTPESASTEPQTFSQKTNEESAAPLTAEPEEPTEAPSPDAAYLADVRDALAGSGGNDIPDATDAQLIEAAHAACELMLSGTDQWDVTVIEGEERGEVGFKDSVRIAGSAIEHYCPEARPEG